ncbi:MAG: hypothetical protein ACP5N2_06075 [Candidatus Nanoarchaeia archaeon]
MVIYYHLLDAENYLVMIKTVLIRDAEDLLKTIPDYLNTNDDLNKHITKIKKIIDKISQRQISITDIALRLKTNLRSKEKLKPIYLHTLTTCLTEFSNSYIPPLIKEFSSISQILIETDNVNDLFIDKYNMLKNNIDHLSNLNNNLQKKMKSDYILLENLDKNSKFTHPRFTIFGNKKQITKTIEVNHKKIKINLNNLVNFEKDKMNNQTIISNINQKIDNILETNKDLPQDKELNLYRIRKLGTERIVTEILELIANTIADILFRHPDLIRSTNTNLNFSLQHTDKHSGAYYPQKSNFDNIFIGLRMSDEIINYYLFDYKIFNPDSKIYDTLVHELTHSHDWILNKPGLNESLYELTKKILNEQEPSMLSLQLMQVVLKCRDEGLAFLSSALRTQITASNKHAIINLVPLLSYYSASINTFDELVKETLNINEDKSTTDIATNIYRQGITHKFGLRMIMNIFFFQYRDKIKIAAHSDSQFITFINSQPNLETRECEEYIKSNNIKIYTIYEVVANPRLLSKIKYVHLIVNDPSFSNNYEQFLTKISLMNTLRFLENYENACDKLNIKNKVLTTDLFRQAHNNYLRSL